MRKLMKKLMVFCLTIVMFAMTSSVALAAVVKYDPESYDPGAYKPGDVISDGMHRIYATDNTSERCGYTYESLDSANRTMTIWHSENCHNFGCPCLICADNWKKNSPCYDADGNNVHNDSCNYLLCQCPECTAERAINSPCGGWDSMDGNPFHKDYCTEPLCLCTKCFNKNIAAGDGKGFASVQLDVVRYPVEGGYLKFDKNSGAIIRCYGDVTSVDIPAQIEGVPVTKIGNGAFAVTSYGTGAYKDGKNLVSVTIPNGVTSIGYGAFSGCVNLGKTLTIPDSVTSIGEKAFFECKNLTLVTLSKNLSTIPESAFEGCTNLYSIDIPNSVTSIDKKAFYNCGNLVKLTIGNNVASIGESAFKDCANLTSVTIPDSVTSIGKEAFSGCLLVKQLTLGNSVASIGDSAFAKCYQLPEVTLPNSVITIGNYAFSSCQLTKAIIPHGVATIGSHAFDGNKLTVISIPTSVTSIGYEAFPVRIVYDEYDDSYDVYYAGSEEQWALVDKGNDNFFPTERMHFNSTAPGQPSTNPGGTDTPGGNDKPQTVPVTNVTMSTNALNLAIGDNAVLTAKVAPENATNKQVIFTSSNEKVATVDANGKVTAIAAGNATITATTEDGGKTAICTITVTEKKIPVASVTLDKTALTLEVKTAAQLNATVLPADATNKTVAWTTSNDKIATVDNTGKVTAVGKGTATITATAGDQKSACTVTVTADKVYTITFDTDGGTLANGAAKTDYVTKGQGYKMPGATKSGYTLKHWAIGAKDSATTAKANETYTFTADTTVYAVWDRNSTSGGSHSGGNRNPSGTSTPTKPEQPTKPNRRPSAR